MIAHWQSLIANLAVVALFISAWLHGQFVLARSSRRWRKVAFGAVMGLGTAASMLLSLQIEPGVIFDLRTSLLVISGFFGGPAAAAVTAGIAMASRLAVGGTGAMIGLIAIGVAALLGVAVPRLAALLRLSPEGAVIALAGAAAAASIPPRLLLHGVTDAAVVELSVAIVGANALATAVYACLILRHRAIEGERDLLQAAFNESPDYAYVKTADLRYAAVNMNVTAFNGFASPAQMVGKTDFDLTSPERAQMLMDGERRILATGEPLMGMEEEITGPKGEPIWVVTTKVPLHDSDGEIIGIAGVTRDITVRRRLREEIVESRNQLNYVLSEVTDGIAMFDAQGTLVYCNEQYREYFPLTAEVRRPGRTIRDILAAVARCGEQKGIPADGREHWVEEIADTLKVTSEQEIQLFNDRWLHVRSRPTEDGSALVVVSDVTTIKAAEASLLGMTERLRLLATTDGLTGLTNRRAFDQALELELARSRRSMRPLALLMIDVDRFKAYNDVHGHQAGDEALRQVGQCLKSSLKRPGDIVARYGGEEFVVVLPGTEEDGAFFIADSFRERLKALGLPHPGGDKGVLTASIGIAVFTERDMGMNAIELVRRADAALYEAKGAGRDRVMGWQPHSEIRPIRHGRS